MSAKNPGRIAKLEALLSRVQSRASSPRAFPGSGNGAAVHAVAAATAEFAEQEEHTQLDAVQVADIRTAPPPADAPPADSYDDDAEVEVSSEVVEVDIDVDEPIAAESGAQPVSHVTEPPAELEEVVDDDVPVNTRPSGASEEIAAQPANELEEPAPSSSRRPIGDEDAAAAYAEESSPRHTPPPESGKQVAVSPSAHPPRKSTVPPPPSLEGHTLIGGWREPGLAGAGAPGAGGPGGTGVRVPPPPHAPAGPPLVPAAAGSSPQVSPAQASGTRLSPDVTRPELPQGAKVATIEGASQIAKPATMGDLLDLTLGL